MGRLSAVTSPVAPTTPIEALMLSILAAIHENTDEVRGLRADLVARRGSEQTTASALSRADRALLAKLLPAIAGARGSEEFTSRDLAADSSPALRLVLRRLSVKQIGRLLARAEGIAIDGWIVQRCGIEINVALWRVVAAVSHRLESGTDLSRSGSIDVGEHPHA
jgi:hypothetical protein